MNNFETRDADVLVLGAGLAGLRAAQAAAEARPRLRVAAAWQGRGPTGSSFANPNGRLGLHLPDTDKARHAFVDRVLRLAAPGFVDPALATALAEDATTRFAELTDLGLSFQTEASGAIARYPSCFAQSEPNAVILTDLGRAFSLFRDKVAACGAALWPQTRILRLLTDPDSGRVSGALLQGPDGPAAVRAKTVVAALGGPAGLFALRGTGAGNRGEAHALLAEAGAALVNEGWLQFMWTRISDRSFWPVQELARPGFAVMNPDGGPDSLPPKLTDLAAARAAHCPMSHGLPDAALDQFVLSRLGPDGCASILAPDGRIFQAAPMAHAGNGGARIDLSGRTSTPGLYAAGECASGMHGANRIGGAMVLACLVFGERAGRAAALETENAPMPRSGRIRELAARALEDAGPDESGQAPITPDMHAAVVLGGGPMLAKVHARLAAAAEHFGQAGQAALLARAAGLITGFLLKQEKQPNETP